MSFTFRVHFGGVCAFFAVGEDPQATDVVLPNGLGSEPGVEPHVAQLLIHPFDVDPTSDPVGTATLLARQHLDVIGAGADSAGAPHADGLVDYPRFDALPGFPGASSLLSGVRGASSISPSVGARIRLVGGRLTADKITVDKWQFETESGANVQPCKTYPTVITWEQTIASPTVRIAIYVNGSTKKKEKTITLRPSNGSSVEVVLSNLEMVVVPPGSVARDFRLVYRLFGAPVADKYLMRRCAAGPPVHEVGSEVVLAEHVAARRSLVGVDAKPKPGGVIPASIRLPCIGGSNR